MRDGCSVNVASAVEKEPGAFARDVNTTIQRDPRLDPFDASDETHTNGLRFFDPSFAPRPKSRPCTGSTDSEHQPGVCSVLKPEVRIERRFRANLTPTRLPLGFKQSKRSVP